MHPMEGRRFDLDLKTAFIDRLGRVLVCSGEANTFHWGDEYYISVYSGIAHLVKLTESGAEYYTNAFNHHTGSWSNLWDDCSPADLFERAVFLKNEVDYQYVDDIRTVLLRKTYNNLPVSNDIKVPAGLRASFNNFYIKFKYGR